jgi:pentatricopeptide repeat-containing protein PET309
MIEPVASGVLSVLLPRHVAFMPSSSSSLKKVVNGSCRPSLSANFFTPTPRSDKGKAKAVDEPPVEEILGCQSWATPSSKQDVWNQGQFI